MPDALPIVHLRLALFQPDIAGNVGTLARLAACLDVALDVIEPCGFAFSDKAFARAGMDYAAHVRLTRHADWAAFAACQQARGGRLVLLTTQAATPYTDFAFHHDDVLLTGRESAGVPDHVRAATSAQVRVPMRASLRSLNVAVAAAMVLGEALRQTRGFAP